jgi:ABC-type antimicrobial peptide transport system permease subunit
LGTIGLAVVQLRNVLERRGELALLRAAGFRRAALARLVMLENAALLVAGLAVGTVAAAVAVLPHLAGRGAAPPWGLLAALLALVLAAGLLAGLAAVRAVLRTPLFAALREER